MAWVSKGAVKQLREHSDWNFLELLAEKPELALAQRTQARLRSMAAKGKQTMSETGQVEQWKEEARTDAHLSDTDFLRAVADHPNTRLVSHDASDRLRTLAHDLEIQRTAHLKGLQAAVGECPTESGSLDEDAKILEQMAAGLPPITDSRLHRDLLRIASRLKSPPEPSCEYCDGHGFFFPEISPFAVEAQKEICIRLCDCKAGAKRDLDTFREDLIDAIEEGEYPVWITLAGTLKNILAELSLGTLRPRNLLVELIAKIEEAQS